MTHEELNMLLIDISVPLRDKSGGTPSGTLHGADPDAIADLANKVNGIIAVLMRAKLEPRDDAILDARWAE